MKNVLPVFDFPTRSRVTSSGLSGIEVGGKLFYEISDYSEFYETFGYTKELAKVSLFDEFMWDKYTRPHAEKETACIQALIVTYLDKNSNSFVDEYRSAYENKIGTCVSDKITACDHCIDCIMHPSKFYK